MDKKRVVRLGMNIDEGENAKFLREKGRRRVVELEEKTAKTKEQAKTSDAE